MNPQSHKLNIKKVNLLLFFIFVLLTYYSYEKINSLLGLQLGYFWLGFALQLVTYWKLKSVA